jgi:predicted PurR-regulated permease PerM
MADISTARRSLIFWAIACLFLAVLATAYIASEAFLLAFGGVLFGTALRGSAELVSRKLGWNARWSLAACLLVLAFIVIAAGWWIVPTVSAQAAQLSQKLGVAYDAVRQRAETWGVGGGQLVDGSGELKQRLGSFAIRAAGFLASAAGALGALLFVAFVALYVAANPEVYQSGVIHLVPRAQRDRAAATLSALASTLRRWLLGRVLSMLAVGLTTSLGLWALGIPLPLTLGVIAGVFGFVPNLGPIVSAVPALLVALTLGPLDALYVAALYVAVNLADGYALTPFLQKRAVSVPPALILLGQVVMGALWGVLGVMFATPILACVIVLIRELYVGPALEQSDGSEQTHG